MKVHPILWGAALSLGTQLYGAQGILTDDATVQQLLPGANFGALPQLQVGATSQAFLRFSLSGLPPGAVSGSIQKATIRLYVNRVSAAGSVEFRYVQTAWSEKTITYIGAPSINAATDLFTVDVANSFVSFEVTKLVQAALQSGMTSFGVALMATGGTEVFFDSKESTGTSQPAQLEIDLAGTVGPRGIQGIQGPQGVPGPQGQPGTAGSMGLIGPIGPQGSAGPKGDTGSSTVVGNLSSFQLLETTLDATSSGTFRLSCPSGYPTLVSGGCGFPFHVGSLAQQAAADVKVIYSGPSTSNSNGAWECSVNNGALVSRVVRVYVQCAR